MTQRELKFRAWDYEASPEPAMTEPFYIFSTPPPPGDFELMQFTGLKDKNGVEIYEGDILSPEAYAKASFGNCEVIFYEGRFGLKKRLPFIGRFTDLSGLISRGKKAGNETIIIGNIHENPELLRNPN